MAYDLLDVDILLQAVRSGTHRVVIARIHPSDVVALPRLHMSVDTIREALRVNAVVPDHSVERGMLFVDTKVAR
jgi:hypothetical protein